MQFTITQALVDECLAIPFNDKNSTNCVVATAMAREMNLPVGQVDCGWTLARVLSGEHKGLYKLSDNAANIVKGFDAARGAKFRNATIPAVELGVIEYSRLVPDLLLSREDDVLEPSSCRCRVLPGE